MATKALKPVPDGMQVGEPPFGYNTINTFVIVKKSASKFIEFTTSVFDAEEEVDVSNS
jgi:hypothetical protein